jgi:CheY-like chemotaxis protein
LLVEDNPADVRLVREALRDVPTTPQLTVATDGESAWRQLQSIAVSEQGLPDLIVLDLNLPGRGGLEVLADCKQHAVLRTIPVIVLTTSLATDDVDDSYARHANGYVAKPINLDEFLETIQAIAGFWLETATLPSSPRGAT